MESIFNNLQSVLLGLGVTLATIAFIVLGIKAMMTFSKGGGIRDVFQGVGVIMVGIFLIGGGSALAAALMQIAEGL